MSSQPSTAKPSLGATLGALYIGATLAAVLFGITNLQTVIYYKKYPHDWWLFRYSVALLWVLDALHVALPTHALYFYLVGMFGDLAGALVHSVWSFKVQLDVNVLIVVYVQGLYAVRLWKRPFFGVPRLLLARLTSFVVGRHFHKIFPCFVFLAVAASLGASIFTIYDSCMTKNFSSISAIKTSIYTVFVTNAVTDCTISFMMCYYLHKSRAVARFSTTASLLLDLMRLILVSGLATSACSLLALISYIVWPKTLIFLGIDFILPKLYINSLLAMFNYRHEHHESNNLNADCGGQSTPAVLRIAPHLSEGSIAGTNISIPLSEIEDIHSFRDRFRHSKGALDHNQV
ncbi:hypothetical protein ARMSODRAFT_1088806 [Armillaria solidipes]|uniref:DUF6534 domain-containing protein n=1 Tax=Armillaria solidipes TaxID=1076256 RepID=A0A2H3BIX8_9AGAR|nr:hypothetical protein ARMSODRAFT_1088806 [Armillaria solidipes]